MSQLLNLVFDSTKVSIYRSKDGLASLLDELKIESAASFFLENLKEVIRKKHQHPELIRIYNSPEKYTLIPSSLFLPSKIDDYFQLNFGPKNFDEIILHESILPIGFVIIFSIPKWLNNLHSEINTYGDVKTIQGRNLEIAHEIISQNLIFCSIHQDKMDVVVKSNGKFILSNQYEVQSEEDIVYFVLLVIQKLNMLESTALQLSCNSTKIDLERYKAISASIEELSNLSIEIIPCNDFYNSILCA